MAKAIPNPYGKADRALLDKIEADRPCSATRKAKEEEYKELHKVVCNMFAEDGECIVIAQKITTKMYEEMCRMW